MKKGTWILLLVALALGAYVYFYELPKGTPRDAPKDETKPAFSFAAEDVASVSLTRGDARILFERKNDEWVITQPVSTRADQGAASSIASGIAEARVSRTLPGSPDKLTSYGLNQPAVTLEVTLKSGAKHSLRLGSKDFSGSYVYAQRGDSKDIVLLPNSLLASADKPLAELRDRAVLNFSQWDVTAIRLNNRAGRFRLEKQGDEWHILEPRPLLADSSEVSSLLSQVSSARLKEVVAEAAEKPAQYGLERAAVSLTVRTDKGDERTLAIGGKKGEAYYARDHSRSMVFLVAPDLVKQLDVSLAKLRDKRILRLDSEQMTRIELRTQQLRFVCEKNPDGKWIVREPPDHKDKEAMPSRIFNAVEFARADEVFDVPPAGAASRLRKPAVELALTNKEGKVIRLAVSAAEKESVYVGTSAGPIVFKAGKSLLDDLNLKAADLVR